MSVGEIVPSRTSSCGPAEASAFAAKAQRFLDAAKLFANDEPDVAASNAVLAAIAASDAVCCVRLRRRSRGQSHGDAVELLQDVDAEAAKKLRQALAAKTRAQYDHRPMTKSESTRAIRAAEWLVERAIVEAT